MVNSIPVVIAPSHRLDSSPTLLPFPGFLPFLYLQLSSANSLCLFLALPGHKGQKWTLVQNHKRNFHELLILLFGGAWLKESKLCKSWKTCIQTINQEHLNWQKNPPWASEACWRKVCTHKKQQHRHSCNVGKTPTPNQSQCLANDAIVRVTIHQNLH